MFNETEIDFKTNVATNSQSNAQDKEYDPGRFHLKVEPSEGEVQYQVGVSSSEQEETQVKEMMMKNK